jgi:regulator of nonsense transcripts 2
MQETLAQRMNEAIKLLQDRRVAREGNVGAVRPAEEDLKKLDSSMKRNTALIRKLKQLSDESCQAILDDITRTNQSMYVSEAAIAIVEAPFKLKDIPGVVRVCSALHQRYAEFSQLLISALTRSLVYDQAGLETPVPRKRTILRLLVELLLVGVYQTHGALLKIVKELTRVDSIRVPRDHALTSVLLTTAFVKAGKDEIMGLGESTLSDVCALDDQGTDGKATNRIDPVVVAQYKEEVSKRWTLPTEVQESFRQSVLALFDSSCNALQIEHDRLTETELENEKVLNTRGDLSESRTAAYEEQRASFETLQRHVANLAEALDRLFQNLNLRPSHDYPESKTCLTRNPVNLFLSPLHPLKTKRREPFMKTYQTCVRLFRLFFCTLGLEVQSHLLSTF